MTTFCKCKSHYTKGVYNENNQLYTLFTTVGCFDHWGYNGFEKVGKTTSDETVNYCGGGKQKGGKSRPTRRMFDF